MKIITLLLALLNIHTAIFAQSEPNTTVEQEPFRYFSYFQKKKVHGMRKQVILTGRSVGSPPDTSSIEEFDTEGNLTSKISFSGNERKSIIFKVTRKDGLQNKWKMLSIPFKGNIRHNTTTYLPNGNPSSFKNDEVNRAGDTVLRGLVNYTYNDKEQLVERAEYINGKSHIMRRHQYVNGDMVKVESKIANSDGTSVYAYTYDENHLPVKKEEIYNNEFGSKVTQTSTYTYEQGKLVNERYTNSEGDKQDVVIKYTYDSIGRTSNFRLQRDSFYREVTFIYSDDKLIQIMAKGNTTLGFIREFYIGSPYDDPKIHLNFRQDFIYDEKGHLIQHTQFLDGTKLRWTEFQIEYW